MNKVQTARSILGASNWYYNTFSFTLTKEFNFKDFRGAWAFLRLLTFQRDILPANSLKYEFSNTYNKVSFRVPINELSTVQVIENVYKYSEDGHIKLDKF